MLKIVEMAGAKEWRCLILKGVWLVLKSRDGWYRTEGCGNGTEGCEES